MQLMKYENYTHRKYVVPHHEYELVVIFLSYGKEKFVLAGNQFCILSRQSTWRPIPRTLKLMIPCYVS